VEKVAGLENPWINLKLTPNLPVRTTHEMLTEAFKVLIKNANEAIRDLTEEQKSISVESYLKEDFIEVVIRDSGSGIRPENLERVFDMRFTTKASGLGFGLFWTKDYIEGLGGTINVSSIVGHGTVFTINLPIAQAQEE